MKNKYLLLRHAETIKDPNTHPTYWLLTPEALDKINEYINTGEFANITKIVCSTEPKAIATGKPISEYLKLPILEMDEFVEVKREKKFLTEVEFLTQKQQELELINEKINGVESGSEAIARFQFGIEKLENQFENANILIITHGTIMSLFLANHNNNFENIFENWKHLKFCKLINLN